MDWTEEGNVVVGEGVEPSELGEGVLIENKLILMENKIGEEEVLYLRVLGEKEVIRV